MLRLFRVLFKAPGKIRRKEGLTNANIFIFEAHGGLMDGERGRGTQTVCLRNKPIYFSAVPFLPEGVPRGKVNF